MKLSRILFILAGLFIGLLLIEIFFRSFPSITGVYTTQHNSIPKIYTEDKERGYALLPDSKSRHISYYGDFDVVYHVNSQGVRSLKDTYGDKYAKRILLLGDSFVFGHGVEDNETLSSRLENALNEKYGDSEFEVINGGISGYNIDQEYLTLKKYSFLKPDIVLIGMCSNDVVEIKNNNWVVDNKGDIIKVITNIYADNDNRLRFVSDFSEKRVIEFLRRHSYTYTFLGILKQVIRSKLRGRYREYRLDPSGLNKSIKVFSLFDSFCNNIGAELIIFSVEPSKSGSDSLIEYLKKDSKKDGFQFFDITGLYSLEKDLFYPRDGHWSPSGTKIIADWLTDKIINKYE
ncbi:MAG: SGNH/GDSL hydrolase family protein [Candidatus Omnitrophota bacterium]